MYLEMLILYNVDFRILAEPMAEPIDVMLKTNSVRVMQILILTSKLIKNPKEWSRFLFKNHELFLNKYVSFFQALSSMKYLSLTCFVNFFKNGKLVIMDCSVRADPAPTIVWYHSGKVVEKSSKVSIKIEKKEDVYYIRLELKDPNKEDSGLYKCNIKNQFGELNANLTLNIESEYVSFLTENFLFR